MEELLRRETELRERLQRRVETPGFGTIFFAGVQAGQIGFLTRRWTKGIGKQLLGTASERLLRQAQGVARTAPTLFGEILPSVVSPFQLLQYGQFIKTRRPAQEAPAQPYIPLQLQGQLAQKYQPKLAVELVQQFQSPESVERMIVQPRQIAAGIKSITGSIYRQLAAGSDVPFAKRLAGQLSQAKQLFSQQFWRQTYTKTREQILFKYQQPLQSLLDIQRVFNEQYPRAITGEIQRWQRQLHSQYGVSELAQRMGLVPVTLGEIVNVEEITRRMQSIVRVPNQFQASEWLRQVIAKYPDLAKLPVGYGWYKRAGETIKGLAQIRLIPPAKLSALDVQLRAAKSLQIPYLAFNPLRLIIPPTLERKLFGEAIVEFAPTEIVPTFVGQMQQSEVQLLRWLISQKSESPETQQAIRQLREMLRTGGDIWKVQTLKFKLLPQFKQPEDLRFVVVGEQPYAVWSVQEKLHVKPVRFMFKGQAVPVEQVGSGIYRSYFMMLGATTPVQGSDIVFSQTYNLQPNIFQTLYAKVQSLLGQDEFLRRFKDIQQQPPSTDIAMAYIGDLLAKLRAKGYFRKYYSNIEIQELSDKYIRQIWHTVFDEESRTVQHIDKRIIRQVSKLEPQEQSVITELLISGRNIVTEEWLSQTVKQGGRSRREILQDILYMYDVLVGKQHLSEDIEEPIRGLLKELSAVFTGLKKSEEQLQQIASPEQMTDLYGQARKLLTGFGQFFEADQTIYNKFTYQTNRFLFIPRALTIEEQIQLGQPTAVLEQFVPGIFKAGTKSTQRMLVTEPGLMLTHFFYRPVELMETLGLGGIDYTKVHNAFDILKRVFTRKILPLAAGITQFATLDQLTGIGTLSWGLLGDLYVGSISLLNLIGIGPMQRYIHTHAPSLLQTTMQAVGLYQSGGELQPQFALGQIGQMLERTPTTKEQQLYQEGVGLVEKRKAAGWEYGRGPYWGQYAQYYRPFLPYLYEREWQFSQNVYGSKFEYLAYGFPFPNPFNLFGLTWLLDPYHYERTRWYYRPYPVSGPLPFTEIPFIGPLLTPISYLFKPPLNLVSILPGELVEVQTDRYGFGYMQVQREYLRSGNIAQFGQSSGAYSQTSMMKQLSDYLGVVGFMSTQLTAEQFQGEYEFYRPKLQHSGMWGSVERLYYMSKLGNIFGLTEFVRRMIPHEEAGYPQFNPLANLYLSRFEWLPERFKTGDQYQTIDFGEVRLPGPQYAKTRIMIDRYGPIDQFLILQNVQPFSQEYERAKRTVLAMLEQNPGMFSELTKFLIQQQLDNAETVRKGLDEYRRFYTQEFETETVQLGEYLGGGMFKVPGKTYLLRVSGVITDENELAYRIYRTKNVSLEEQYALARQLSGRIERQLAGMAGSEVKITVLKDEMQRYTYTESGELILEAGLRMDVPNVARDYSAKMQYATLGFNPLRQIWDVQSQFIPETFLFEKFFAYREPIELYERYSVLGKYRMLWHRVVQDIIVPNFNILRGQNPISAFLGGLTTGWLASPDTITRQVMQQLFGLAYAGQSLLPQSPSAETRERWEFERRMEMLQTLQDQMRGSRPRGLLSIQTVKGYGTFYELAPLEYRKFIPYFVNTSAEEIERLRTILPDYVRQVAEQVWLAKRQAIERQKEGRTLDFRTEVQRTVGDIDVDQDLEQIGDVLEYIDLRTYRQLSQLQEFSDVTQLSVTPQVVHQQMISMLDQRYLSRKPYSTAMFNAEYMRQLADTARYMGEQRVVLSQDRQRTRYNYFVGVSR